MSATIYVHHKHCHSAEGGECDCIPEEKQMGERMVRCLNCMGQIPYRLGTCPHCGYVEFK